MLPFMAILDLFFQVNFFIGLTHDGCGLLPFWLLVCA